MIFRNSKSLPSVSPTTNNRGRQLLIIGAGFLVAALLVLIFLGSTSKSRSLETYKSKNFSISIPKEFSMVGLKVNGTSTVFAKTKPSGEKIDDEILTVTKYIKTKDPTKALSTIEGQSTKTADGKRVDNVESKYITIGKAQSLKITNTQSTAFYIPSGQYVWRISADFEKEGLLSKDIETIAKSFSTNNQK